MSSERSLSIIMWISELGIISLRVSRAKYSSGYPAFSRKISPETFAVGLLGEEMGWRELPSRMKHGEDRACLATQHGKEKAAHIHNRRIWAS
eukprot:6190778-Pleurochrysis_carterae.AAC.3